MNDHTRWYYLARAVAFVLALLLAVSVTVAFARASETVDPAGERLACFSEATLDESRLVLDTCVHKQDEWFTLRVPAGHAVDQSYAIRYDPNVFHVDHGIRSDADGWRSVTIRVRVLDGVTSVGSAPGEVDTGFGQIRLVAEFVPVDPAHTGGA